MSLGQGPKGTAGMSKPDEIADSKGYGQWLVGWVLAAETAIDFWKKVCEQIRLGRYDGDLRLI